MSGAFDPLSALAALERHGVRFVLIGGLAGRILGSPTVTNDLDICYARDADNLERLAAALRDLGAQLRGADEDLPFRLDARTLAAGDHFTFSTSTGSLDVLGTPAGTEGYDDLAHRAVSYEVDDISLQVAHVRDLIRMKQAAGRPKDRVEIEVLAALAEERGE